MVTKTLLIITNTPSPNTKRLADAVLTGANSADCETVTARLKSPFDATAADILSCDAIVLGTTENLGYMSGALKDFFDRIYYPCLEKTQGLPCALYVRAGHDGTGTRRAIETIVTGLKWRWVQPPLILRGDFQEDFADQCRDLGMTMAASLDVGII